MTKKLEEMLNLPESKKTAKKEKKTEEELARESAPPENLFRDIEEFDKISSALPQVKGLGDLSDTEFDALAQRATDAYDDLMDLGMNVEARYSSRVFEVASSMLKNAIDAKSAKIDKKLKMIELQLKKAKLDQDAKGKGAGEGDFEGDGYVITDRNSLLEKLRNIK
jgi:hypothetical protein